MFRRQRSVTVLGGLTACLSTLSARRVEDLRTPCLICCRATLEKNAATMRERAAALGVALRPHFKTVKTLEAAEIATDGERRRTTVSTLAAASLPAGGAVGEEGCLGERGHGDAPPLAVRGGLRRLERIDRLSVRP